MRIVVDYDDDYRCPVISGLFTLVSVHGDAKYKVRQQINAGVLLLLHV